MPPFSHRRLRASALLSLLLVILSPVLVPLPARAQPPEPIPIKPLFGIGDNEFMKSAWVKLKPGGPATHDTTIRNNMGDLWDLMEDLNIQVMRYQMDETWDKINAIGESTKRRPYQRLATFSGMWGQDTAFGHASTGREVIFYPFNVGGVRVDSVQFPTWACKFMAVQGGKLDSNSFEVDSWNEPAKEQHYKTDSTTPNTVIAEGLAFDHIPVQQYRWPSESGGAEWAPSQIATWSFLDGLGNPADSILYVTVTGHLFLTDGDGNLGDSILKIEVFHEIPMNTLRYQNTDPSDTNGWTTDTNDVSRLLATLYVTRADLVRQLPNS